MTGLTTPPFAWPDGVLDRRRVVQCALSRVCGGCGRPLTRPIVFVGTAEEVGRNSFHTPPLHPDCARELVDAGFAGTVSLDTPGFEFVRPSTDDRDQEPRFTPHAGT